MDWEKKQQNKTKEQAGVLTPGEQLPSKATLNYSSDGCETAKLQWWNQGLAEVSGSFIVDFSEVRISSRGTKQKPNKSLFGLPVPPQPAKYEHEVSAGETGQEECGGERGHLLSHHPIQLEIADKLSSARWAFWSGQGGRIPISRALKM